jgi:hypothetical protein
VHAGNLELSTDLAADILENEMVLYRGADKSLTRPSSPCILFNGENISFDASLVTYIYINSTNIPQIMIINRIYEHENFRRCSCFLPGRAKDLSALLYS